MTLRTKILPAPVAPAALPRARLQARLDQGLSRRLTTVIAGAGVGKSTLLAAWAQRHDVAWYTLGFTHHPAPEEYPVMTADTVGFEIKPDGFFDRNPALDAPTQP